MLSIFPRGYYCVDVCPAAGRGIGELNFRLNEGLLCSELMMGAVLGLSRKPSSPQKKYTAEARDKLVEAGTSLPR